MVRERKWRLGPVFLILALLVVTAVWWVYRPVEDGIIERDSSLRVQRASFRLRSETGPGSAAKMPSWLLEPGIEGRRIAGTVRANGEPLAGARVELRGESLRFAQTDTPTAKTDDSGRFDLGVQPPASYAVMASAEGYALRGVRVNLRDPDGVPPPAEITIDLSRCESWIFGEVQDVYGGVVAEGAVSIAAKIDGRSWFHEIFQAPLEPDGSFALCRPRDLQQLWVSAPGYGTVWLRGAMPEGGWRVRLFPGGTVSGVVIDEDDRPIAGARVVLMKAGGAGDLQAPLAQTTFSRADGSFRFTDINPGRYDLAADHGRYYTGGEWLTATVAPGQHAHGVVIAMQACRGLAGVVLLDGEPLAGARVGPLYEAFTQSDGSFVIGCASFDRVELRVQRYDVGDATIPAGREDIDDLVVRVRRRASVSGTVTAGGEPVEGAVVADGDPSGFVGMPSVFGESYRTLTDARGSYELTGLPAGSHDIEAWDPASQRRSEPVRVEVARRGEVGGVELELERRASISGTVVDPDDAPIRGVRVSISKTGEAAETRTSSARTDESGSFRLEGLGAGRYAICLGHCIHGGTDPRYLPLDREAWPPIEIESDDAKVEARLVVRSRRGLSIRGQVRDDRGNAVALAVVRTALREAQTTADDAGRFMLDDLAEGEYNLTALAADNSIGRIEGVLAGSHKVEIVIDRVGAIQGSVAGAGRCTFKAGRLVHTPGGQAFAPFGGRTTIGARAFRFEGVRPGEYRVEAHCREGVASKTIEVRPGETEEVELTAGSAARVRGRARWFPGGEPASGISCHAGPATDTTGPSGAFELAQVLPGDALVVCSEWSGSRFSTGQILVEARANETVTAAVLVVEGSIPREIPARTAPQELLGARLERVPGEDAIAFTHVIADGPADRAGIESGDVLLSVAGASALGPSSEAARIYIESREPETEIALTVRRAGEPLRVNLLLGSARR